MTVNTVGARLTAYRHYLDYRQDEFAQMLGTDAAVISRWETNKTQPRLVYLKMLAEHGLNLNWLVTGQGEMIISSSDKVYLEMLNKLVSQYDQLNDNDKMLLNGLSSLLLDRLKK